MKKTLLLLLGLSFLISSCNRDSLVIPEESESVTQPVDSVTGVYILNEGNMGSNKATLDFFDYQEGVYHRNIYAEANPNVVKEMGDVGNDIMIYGSKMYIVLNASNKLEILDAKTSKKIEQIDISNGRSLAHHNGFVYVSSYDGPISIDPSAPIGRVYEIDTVSLSISGSTTVGYQPEEMAVVDNKLYVANSGGYRVPDYDNTISVIDLNSFQEIDKYEVAINLNKLKKGPNGDLFVTSRGDYQSTGSNLFRIDAETGEIKKTYDIPVMDFAIYRDRLYYYANEFSYNTFDWLKSFGVIDLTSNEILASDFIAKEYQEEIETPYGIAINPDNGDIFLTDAGNYVSTGFVYCFDHNGQLKFKTEGGNIPAHFAFLTTQFYNQ